MSLKSYLIIISISTALCWIGFLSVLLSINPETTGWRGFLFFYGSLFLALIGSFSLLGFASRFLIKRDLVLYKQINIASRQAIMLALLMVTVLVLQSQRYLFWWNIILLIIIFSLLELFFITYKKFGK